jgi:2-haloacid dehalogenase
MTRWATFDCYGTLIDWNAGIGGELRRLWPEADTAALLARYHEVEPRVQMGAALPYREVLRESLALLAEHEGLPLASEDEHALADSLPGWPVFPEVPAALRALRERGWRLGVLSNTDPDLLAGSLAAIGVPVDVAITAAEARSYKPAHGHWERFFAETGADRTGHVHVAASAYHDLAPAAELGLVAVWINRLGEESDRPRAADLLDLSQLPDTLERLVPAATLSG